MLQTGYVFFSIDTLFDMFDLSLGAILGTRMGKCYLVLTHSSKCLTFVWRLHRASDQVRLI